MAYDHEYYLKNREKFLESTKKYIEKKRSENDEEWLAERAEYMKEYLRTHPEQKAKKREYDKNYYQTHKEYFKAKQKEYKKRKENIIGEEENE